MPVLNAAIQIYCPYPATQAWGAYPSPAQLREIGYERLKRVVDVVVCLLALPFVLLVLAVCALAIKLDSLGPVFTMEHRAGKDGRRFELFGLRTVVVNADVLNRRNARLDGMNCSDRNIIDHAWITRVGHILRATGLEGLPQLYNVLRGDMTLVGPRAMPFGPDTYRLWHTARLEVKPGIIGPWHVSGGELDFDECMRLDLAYIRSRTIALDIEVLLRAVANSVGSGRIVVKRIVDIVFSGMLLLLLAPLMLIIAAAVRWTSPGPVLFRQVRLGKNGRPFKILKFRTMRVDSEAVLATDPVLHATYVANDYKLPPEQDPRILPLGRWLRKTSIDELPQLVNVLRGEMSLVGPRPIVPGEVVHYGDRAASFHSVLPGLTGAWQVWGRSDLHYPARCDVELEYVQAWTLRRDLDILFRTVGVVLSRRGAT